MKDKIFYAVCFGFLAGVALRSFFVFNFHFILLLTLLSFVALLYFSLVKYRIGLIVAVSIFAFSLGALRFAWVELNQPQLLKLGEVSMTGMIVDQPDIRENSQKLTVKTNSLKILVTTNFSQDFKYGDIVKFSGKIEKPENFITDTGKEFDYVNYLRKDGIFYVMNFAEIEIRSRGGGNAFKSTLFALKQKFENVLNLTIASPENLLMSGLILGEKSAFDQTLRQSFIDTGTIHIVALSGYNVTIVAEWFMKLLKIFSINFAIWGGIILVWLFVIMTGMSSTAIRAGVMATLALVARATGRNYDVARALILAAVGMILWNPYLLVFDVSFQLSFIATVAVIFLAPKVEKYFMWVPKTFELRDIVSVTFAAYIFVLPFILYKMGNLSLVALPANALILPFIPFTMLLGFITGFAGVIWYGLAVPLGFVSYLFLKYELLVISFFSQLPFASLAIPNFPLILTLLIYACFLYKLFGRNIKESLSVAEVL